MNGEATRPSVREAKGADLCPVTDTLRPPDAGLRRMEIEHE